MPEDVQQLDEQRRAADRRSRHARAPAREGAARGAGAGARSRATLPRKQQRLVQMRRDISTDPPRLRCRCGTLRSSARARAPDAARRAGATRLGAHARARAAARSSRARSRRTDARSSRARRRFARGATRSRSPSRASTTCARSTIASAAELAASRRSRRRARRSRCRRDGGAGSGAGSGRGAQERSGRARRAADRQAAARRARSRLLRSAHRSQLPAASRDVRARERVPHASSPTRATPSSSSTTSYNIIVLEDGDSEAGHLRRRGRPREPRAASRDLADDRRARGPELLAADSRRGVRLARRVAAAERRRAAARPQDRFEQVILITHIEPVREGLDRVISVRYDEESRRSVVTQSENEERVR